MKQISLKIWPPERCDLRCRILIASIMEEYNKDSWETLIERYRHISISVCHAACSTDPCSSCSAPLSSFKIDLAARMRIGCALAQAKASVNLAGWSKIVHGCVKV